MTTAAQKDAPTPAQQIEELAGRTSARMTPEELAARTAEIRKDPTPLQTDLLAIVDELGEIRRCLREVRQNWRAPAAVVIEADQVGN